MNLALAFTYLIRNQNCRVKHIKDKELVDSSIYQLIKSSTPRHEGSKLSLISTSLYLLYMTKLAWLPQLNLEG